jgi:catechol 2,3-dioxygenase-like lactoylglutathione lyase family enzyme
MSLDVPHVFGACVRSSAVLRIGSIVLRVDDLQRQTKFWQAALGYVRRDDGKSDDFVLLAPSDGAGPHLSLDQVRSTLQVPPRLHLDLYTEDQAAEVERLLTLGVRGSLGQTTARFRLRHPRRPRGQPLLRRRYHPLELIGLIMGFGAGVLISAFAASCRPRPLRARASARSLRLPAVYQDRPEPHVLRRTQTYSMRVRART